MTARPDRRTRPLLGTTPILLPLLVLLSLLLAACGQTSDPGTDAAGDQPATGGTDGGSEGGTADQTDGELAFGLQRCDSDGTWQAADPAFYRDEPVYVGNEMPVEQVRGWAVNQPGFEDIWIDRNHNGWISVGFSAGAADRQPELEEAFPGVGVVAVEVVAGEAELRALRTEVEAALTDVDNWGLGHSVPRGRVEVSVPVLDEATLSSLAPLAGPLLCVDGADPSTAVPDGPQPTGGDGWRLLADDRTGEVYRTGIATDADQYADLWRSTGVDGDPPPVDFETEVVIWFGAVYGSGCPIRLDAVVFDVDERLVHGDFVLPGNPVACNDDANPEAYLVAVDRGRLPEAPFRIQLDAEDPPRGAPEERTTVEVDLREPGSIADGSELVVEYSDGQPPPGPDEFEAGLVIEDGYPWTVAIDITCSFDVLGPLNGVMWVAENPDLRTDPPPEWVLDHNDGLAPAELLLETDPARLTVTIAGHAERFEPAPSNADIETDCG